MKFASIGPVVSEEKRFKECGRQTKDGQTAEAYLSYKLTNEPSAQVSEKCVTNVKSYTVANENLL